MTRIPPAITVVMREAVAAEVLVQASLYPDVEYVFAHALLREVAHVSLTRARRVEAHRRIVSAIEGHHAERPGDQAEWLAHHAAHGELWEKAAIYQGQAADRALARFICGGHLVYCSFLLQKPFESEPLSAYAAG